MVSELFIISSGFFFANTKFKSLTLDVLIPFSPISLFDFFFVHPNFFTFITSIVFSKSLGFLSFFLNELTIDGRFFDFHLAWGFMLLFTIQSNFFHTSNFYKAQLEQFPTMTSPSGINSQGFLGTNEDPPKFISSENQCIEKINLEFLKWEQQD